MRQPTIKTIQYELEVLNKQIDAKIITGRPYKRDALRHKALLRELRSIRDRNGYSFNFGGIFGKMAGALASIVF